MSSLIDDPNDGNEVAPEGSVFVCLACGKMSADKYGYKKISGGWDESCMMNSDVFERSRLVITNGRVTEVK